jgi:hypothetical protein
MSTMLFEIPTDVLQTTVMSPDRGRMKLPVGPKFFTDFDSDLIS